MVLPVVGVLLCLSSLKYTYVFCIFDGFLYNYVYLLTLALGTPNGFTRTYRAERPGGRWCGPLHRFTTNYKLELREKKSERVGRQKAQRLAAQF